MAYDQALAARVRRLTAERPDISERAMFGGLAFMAGGKMFVGIIGGELMVRVGPERLAEALARPHARPMDFTGRRMNGYVYVAAPGVADDGAVREWVNWGLAVAEGVAKAEAAGTRPRRRTTKGRRPPAP